MKTNIFINDDCLNYMKTLEDKSIDLVLTDIPYNTIDQEWDKKINFSLLLNESLRILKDKSPFITTCREPLTSELIYLNKEFYKHKWIWNKKQTGSFQNAKYMPLQIDEDVLVFANGKCNYFPIMRNGNLRTKGGSKKGNQCFNSLGKNYSVISDLYYPVNIVEFPNCIDKQNNFHPTQKPVKLFEYLIKTYSNENDIVLDCFGGSGTTAIACHNLNRKFICVEKDTGYFDKSAIRYNKHIQQIKMFQ